MMPTGVSRLYYLIQTNPTYPLELNNSYFQIKLKNAQAFFPAGWLTQVDFLLLSSSVESSFLQSPPVQSIHKFSMLKKNIPNHLGINTNLTDWLPARTTDTVKISLTYTIIQGTPIKALIDKIEKLDLAAKVSVVRSDVAVAIKVTQIVGNLLSYFLQEGEQTDVFSLTLDLNLADLKSGYYAVIGSRTDEIWPGDLQIDNHGRLTDKNGHELSHHSYAVMQVLAIPRRGSEILREEPWGELLQVSKDQVLSMTFSDEEERSKALQYWRMSLAQVRMLARKDRAFLQKEIDGIIAEAQLEVEGKLHLGMVQEADGLDLYPNEWQEVLRVNTYQELHRTVRDYRDALEISEHLILKYKQSRF